MTLIKTVGDLKRVIEKLPDDMQLAPILIEADGEHEILVPEAVTRRQGTPSRGRRSGTPGFRFDGTGPATWAFLELRREQG